MSPLQVVSRIKNGEKIHLVDVRAPGEFNAVHAEGAILCPLDTLNPRNWPNNLDYPLPLRRPCCVLLEIVQKKLQKSSFQRVSLIALWWRVEPKRGRPQDCR